MNSYEEMLARAERKLWEAYGLLRGAAQAALSVSALTTGQRTLDMCADLEHLLGLREPDDLGQGPTSLDDLHAANSYDQGRE